MKGGAWRGVAAQMRAQGEAGGLHAVQIGGVGGGGASDVSTLHRFGTFCEAR